MKVLIVDDEELTRTGVASSIDWAELGIDEVLQADDGVNGLEMARRYKPEIILCDVRMPRLTGIDMLGEVEKILPDTVSIFMSGYSDKEYLKAAIKLKTVSYIEKPLDPAEIREAILAAKDLYRQKRDSRRDAVLHSMQTVSRLALLLTVPGDSADAASCQARPDTYTIHQLASELNLSVGADTCFSSVIFRLRQQPEDAHSVYEDIYRRLSEFLKETDLHSLYVEKKPQCIVYFLLSSRSFVSPDLQEVYQFLCECYASCGRYLAVAGETGTGLSGAYQSYSSAVVLLQSSFFFPADTLITADSLPPLAVKRPAAPETPPDAAFTRLLLQADTAGCEAFLNDLYQYYHCSQIEMPNQARDLYYKLFLALASARRQEHLPVEESDNNIMDAVEDAFTYDELHEALASRTRRFLSDAQNAAAENTTITLIRDYISKNYMNEMLSVKDISSHVFLSVSYVCTFFKNETGQTLNQYLTEYRMERAKELLGDPQYKISDVSSRVGYSDGNYFSKNFKKYTGLSPSDYREKMTQ